MKPRLLLIHGWNFKNYTSQGCTDAWANRVKFVEELSKSFEIVKFNLPGFCGAPDPEYPWGIDDFVRYVDDVVRDSNPDYILGYSFGGAIALRWQVQNLNPRIKIILISPALMRSYRRTLHLNYVLKFIPSVIRDNLRSMYLGRVAYNPYYTLATPVMQKTYHQVVTVDLRDDLLLLNKPILLIYGENDLDTPPNLIKEWVKRCKPLPEFKILQGGGHDIANTHTSELVTVILNSTGTPH